MSKLTVCAPLRRRGPRAAAAAWRRRAADRRRQAQVIRAGYGPSGRRRGGRTAGVRRPRRSRSCGVGGGLTGDLRDRRPGRRVGGDRRHHDRQLPVGAAAGRRTAAGRPARQAGPDRNRRPAGARRRACGARGGRRDRGRHGVGAAAGRRRRQPRRGAPGHLRHPGALRWSARRIVTGGIAALRSLRQAAPALARWAAAAGPRQVLLASPRSFCAGVERAIEIVELALERHGRRSTSASRSCTTRTVVRRPGAARRDLRRRARARCPTGPTWCSPRTACRPRCGARRRGAA